MNGNTLRIFIDPGSHQIVKSFRFQHFTVNWNYNLLEMALEALRFVQGLHRTPLLFFFALSQPDLLKCIFPKSENLKISNLWKPIFPGSLTSAQKWGLCGFELVLNGFSRFSQFVHGFSLFVRGFLVFYKSNN